MIYQVKDIERDIRVAIDENSRAERLIADEDVETLSLDEMVRSKIEESVRRVVMAAPVHLLDGGVALEDGVFWRDGGCGWLILPDDFMRLVLFRMSDWERPVYEPISAADPLYRLQHSRHRGLRGNPQKPVVAIVTRSEGRVLEFYSCRGEEATIEQGLYMPLPRVDRYGGIEIPERCYRAVVYQAAALVTAAYGQGELSSMMSELSKGLLISSSSN